MSKTLNLFTQLLDAGRILIELGRPLEATKRLNSLIALADVPAPIAADAHRLLGELHLHDESFALARRHLKRSLKQCEDAESRFLLAEAITQDENADWSLARKYYRKALKHRPKDARYLRGYAEWAFQMGHETFGLRLLRKAVKIAPTDLDVLESLSDVLCGQRRFTEAEKLLSIARFQLKNNTRLNQLVSDVQFDRVRARQSSEPTHVERAAVLPFAVDADGGRKPSVIVRQDRQSRSAPHLPRLMAYRPKM